MEVKKQSQNAGLQPEILNTKSKILNEEKQSDIEQNSLRANESALVCTAHTTEFELEKQSQF